MSFDLSRVKEFFSKDPQNRELSSSVVTHDRMDDTYLDELRERSTTFQGVLNNAPTVPLGDPPNECPLCHHSGVDDTTSWWHAKDSKIICRACETTVAMPEGPYKLWGDLVSDMWRSHFTYDEPKVKESAQVKEGHRLHRDVMSNVIYDDTFPDTRALTRLNELESSYCAMQTAYGISDSIASGALAQHAQRAQKLAEKEAEVEQMERELESFRPEWEQNGEPPSDDPVPRGEGGPSGMTEEQVQQLADLADAHDQATQELGEIQADIDQNPIGQDVLDEVQAAVENASEKTEEFGKMMKLAGPGNERGNRSRNDPEKLFALAEQLKDNEVLRMAAEFIGRIEREMQYHRSNRVVGGFEEIVDIEHGNDPSRLLPGELGKLDDPDLELIFDMNYVEKTLDQYEMRGNEPEGKGPIIMHVDESSSMKQGVKIKWAKAIAVAVVNIAHREHRDAAIVSFASDDEQESWFFPANKPLDLEDVVDCITHFFNGGTDITEAVMVGRKIMEEVSQFQKADLCIITDGEDNFQEDDEQEKEILHAAGVRIHGIAIGEGLGYLNKMCDHVTYIHELSNPESGAEAGKALAENIT